MDEHGEQGIHERQEIEMFSRSVERERPISPDSMVSALGNESRRAVVTSLSNAYDGILEYAALTKRVAGRVRDEDTARESDDDHQRTRIALHHRHLPKLADVRIIDYDAETGRIEFSSGDSEQEALAVIEWYDTHQ